MATADKIRLLLIDDHAVMRAGLANMLNATGQFAVVGEAGDAKSGLALQASVRPDVTLLDLTLPDQDGTGVVQEILRRQASARVIMLSSSEAEEDILQSLRAGALGYVSKAAQPEELAAAIKAAHAGQRAVSPQIERRLAQHASDATLTARELDVLRLVRQGMTNPDIARLLNVTIHTAKAHVASILQKLGAADRAEAVARGFERGLLKH